ncbi:DUF2190 family protein [Desulfocurvibacter africanus]|uniref:RecA/RadA recombinase n=1 Tax=Desulfocurvibacter africanus subsp. africanus str. Walvis Bay TaxID=690850 RepID=F3Z2S6_DESAF|nr:DUF2190 family protein [Desulfocurvibacter africanus]EGJ50243.1 protein of unknown function UCP030771 [Desulfocurvibacter africanus subsp. africanus str. Walvis Bay]
MGQTSRFKGETMPYTPSGADVANGAAVLVGDMLGVATALIPDGETGDLVVVGVHELPKTTGTGHAIAQGDTVYWDATAGKITYTDDSAANKAVGKAWAAAGDSAATVLVKLNT